MRHVMGWRQGVVLLGIGLAMSAGATAASDSGTNVRSVLFLAAAPAPEKSETDALPSAQSVFFRRLYAALRQASKTAPATANLSAITTAALPDRTLIVAEADPLYGKWQDQANDRLKLENSTLTAKENPLAAAHPDSYVIICEAGCRGATSQVVYQVTKADAAAAGARLDVPAGATGDAPAAAPQVANVAVPVQDPSTIICVAGCYDSPKVLPARNTTTKAEVPKLAPFAATAAAVTFAHERPQLAHNGAILGPDTSAKHVALSKRIAKAITTRLGARASWRTTIHKTPVRQTLVAKPAAITAVKPIHPEKLNTKPHHKVQVSHGMASKIRWMSKSVAMARDTAATRR